MRKYFYIFTFAAFSLGCVSCQSKSDRIEDLREFVEDLSNESEEFTDEQIEKISEEFSEMSEKLDEYEDLTPEEVKEIAKIKGKYASTMIKKSGSSIKKNMDKAGKALEGFMEGLNED